MNNKLVEFYVQHSADQHALKYLEDVWVERDHQEPRCYTVEFVSTMCLLVLSNPGALPALQRESVFYGQGIEEGVQIRPSPVRSR